MYQVVNKNNSSWITISRTSGSILPMTTENVEITINSIANSMPPGTYITPIYFNNLTNGKGNTARNIELVVLPLTNTGSAILSLLSPESSITFTGSFGGPFNQLIQIFPT
jgi:hypothetical protein